MGRMGFNPISPFIGTFMDPLNGAKDWLKSGKCEQTLNEFYITLVYTVSSAAGSPRQSLNNNNNSNSAFRPVRHQGDTSSIQSHSFDDRSSWKSVETPSGPKRYVHGSNSKCLFTPNCSVTVTVTITNVTLTGKMRQKDQKCRLLTLR